MMGDSDNRGRHLPATEPPWYKQLSVSDQAAYATLGLAVLAIVLSLGVFGYQIISDIETTKSLNASRDALNNVVMQLGVDEQSLRSVSSELTSKSGSLQQLERHSRGELGTLRAADTALAKFVSSAQSEYAFARKTLSVSKQQAARSASSAKAQYDLATKTLATLRLQYNLVYSQYKRSVKIEQNQPNVRFTISYLKGEHQTPIPWQAAPKQFVLPSGSQRTLFFSLGQQNLSDGALAASTLTINELGHNFALSRPFRSTCRTTGKYVLQCNFGAQGTGRIYTTRFGLSSSSAANGLFTIRLRITLAGTTRSGRTFETTSFMTVLLKKTSAQM